MIANPMQPKQEVAERAIDRVWKGFRVLKSDPLPAGGHAYEIQLDHLRVFLTHAAGAVVVWGDVGPVQFNYKVRPRLVRSRRPVTPAFVEGWMMGDLVNPEWCQTICFMDVVAVARERVEEKNLECDLYKWQAILEVLESSDPVALPWQPGEFTARDWCNLCEEYGIAFGDEFVEFFTGFAEDVWIAAAVILRLELLLFDEKKSAEGDP